MRYLLALALVAACSNGNSEQTATAVQKMGGPPGGGGSSCASCSNVTPADPVFLVHGRNDSAARWDDLVADFETRGYTEGQNLFRINMASYCGDNGFCSMLPPPDGTGATYVNESYAKCLARYIDENAPCDGDAGTCPAIDLVTHSQGGIVGRYYARFLATPRDVHAIVAMSGPSQGTNNCALAGNCTGIDPETCPDSNFMHKLNGVSPEGDGSNDETPNAGSVGYNAVVSTKDNVIQPWCSAYFIESPQSIQADDMDCRHPNFTVDSDSESCKIAAQHLVIPDDQNAIDFAYCKIN